MTDRILDSDERVRAAICKVIGSLDVETALHHISEQTLRAVGGRMSDKKVIALSGACHILLINSMPFDRRQHPVWEGFGLQHMGRCG